MLAPGDTFYSSIDEHLWIVLTEPDEDGGVVCVCFVTQKQYTDPTVVCEPGEHPFIKRPTAVAYRFAERFSLKRIKSNLSGGSFTKKERCSEVLFRKIYDGILVSDFTPNRIREIFS